jgi:hypothetical protein
MSQTEHSVKTKQKADRLLVRRSLTGSFTAQKTRALDIAVSPRVKDAVRKSIRRRRVALKELADF